MLAKVTHALGLTLTKPFGQCYSLKTKQVPLISQIKDAQFSFAVFPEKRVKMTILVADIPAAYGILIGKSFCSEVGGEIHMDWSKDRIPIK
ncbi:hypothetical protein KI387_025680, partial [Taxus chinensis]